MLNKHDSIRNTYLIVLYFYLQVVRNVKEIELLSTFTWIWFHFHRRCTCKDHPASGKNLPRHSYCRSSPEIVCTRAFTLSIELRKNGHVVNNIRKPLWFLHIIYQYITTVVGLKLATLVLHQRQVHFLLNQHKFFPRNCSTIWCFSFATCLPIQPKQMF